MNAYIERVRQSERITVNLGGTAGILFLSYDRTGIFYFERLQRCLYCQNDGVSDFIIYYKLNC